MSVIDDIRFVATKLEQYAKFVQLAQSATGLGGPEAAQAIAVIKAGLDALAAGDTGAITPQQVIAELDKLTAGEAADDAAAAAILAGR